MVVYNRNIFYWRFCMSDKQRKLYSRLLLVLGIVLIGFGIISSIKNKQVETTAEDTKVEEAQVVNQSGKELIENPVELHILNEHPDMSGYMYMEDPHPLFKEITVAECLRMFDEKGSGIIVLSADSCPWCEVAIPLVNDVAKQLNQPVYYINSASPYNVANTEEKAKMIDQLQKDLDPVIEPDEDGEKNLYIPFVVAIKDGVPVQGHVALVENVETNEMGPQLSDEQKEELRQIYRDLFMAAAN